MKPVISDALRTLPVAELIKRYPLVESVLLEQGIEFDSSDTMSMETVLQPWCEARNKSVRTFFNIMRKRLREIEEIVAPSLTFETLEIRGGTDKSGAPEPVASIRFSPGDLVAVVGPTGSGKSRLLADIEWLADGDTPSGRKLLMDGNSAAHLRSCFGGRQMVAQLSQTMSFVLDATAEELIALHAESRGADPSVVEETLTAANELCGEPFSGHTPLTNLSGGQTRALMVADTALLCRSPIVLIDELENAGIDRRRAFDLLITNNKVVLLATHDPLLALLAERRISMNNGAISALRYRNGKERAVLATLEKMDAAFGRVRERLRLGEDVLLDYLNADFERR